MKKASGMSIGSRSPQGFSRINAGGKNRRMSSFNHTSKIPFLNSLKQE